MLPVRDAQNGLRGLGAFGIRTAGSRTTVLLDECVPWPMHKLLAGHDCTTAQKRGWGGIKNGDVLRLAEAGFDLFITSDQVDRK